MNVLNRLLAVLVFLVLLATALVTLGLVSGALTTRQVQQV